MAWLDASALGHSAHAYFKPADQLFLDSVKEEALADESIRQAALANSLENFKYVFGKALEGLFIERMEQNEDIFARFMADKEFRSLVEETMRRLVRAGAGGRGGGRGCRMRPPFCRRGLLTRPKPRQPAPEPRIRPLNPLPSGNFRRPSPLGRGPCRFRGAMYMRAVPGWSNGGAAVPRGINAP